VGWVSLVCGPAIAETVISDFDVFSDLSDDPYANIGEADEASSVTVSQPLGSNGLSNLAGTDGRTELEFKLAYEVDKDTTLDDISNVVMLAVSKVINGQNLKFAEMMGRKYLLDAEFQAFLFRDVYIDTPDYRLLESGSAYRVRHRWTRHELFLRHQYLPFMPAFYPNRCEIQFKTGYQPDFERNVVSPTETRFEFRNESAPFDSALDAPPAPWPLAEYIGYALTGRFKGYRMKPMAELMQVLGAGSVVPKLEPQIKVLTIRDRIHLSMKNPWGSGPNPEQVFIITLDKSTVADGYGKPIPDISVLELEVEIERNVSTEIHNMMALSQQDVSRYGAVKDAAVEFSQAAWFALIDDLEAIRASLSDEVTKHTGRSPLPLDYKYARLMGRVLEHAPTAGVSDPAASF
jgi:hypothetical protein